MSTATGVLRRRASPFALWSTIAIVGVTGLGAALLLSAAHSGAGLWRDGAIAGVGALGIWMFFSERYAVTLSVLLLYLGLFDGFIKLKTGSTVATLGRDVLLYAIVGGALARLVLVPRPLRVPRLSVLVVVWGLVCLVQVLNPVVPSITHAFAGVRQHIEFVPLFFLGYAVMRSERRLMGLFGLMLVVAAANGVVGLIQSHLTPAQLAAWGPGYANEVLGTAFQSGRTFVDAAGQSFVRPPGLGSDEGFGGEVAAMALPGALALAMAGGRYRRYLPALAVVVVLSVVALATAQSRTAVVSAAIGIVFFLLLTVTSRRAVAAVGVIVALAAVSYVGLSTVFKGITSAPNRYASIAPTNVLATTVNYREQTLALIPRYIVDYPLGEGIGDNGPAGGSAVGGRVETHRGDAESEPTFLILELGVPGLVVMALLTIWGIRAGVELRTVSDRRLQLAFAALTAVFAAVTVSGVVGVYTANSPTSPFIWLTLGTLAYWHRELLGGRTRRIRAALAMR